MECPNCKKELTYEELKKHLSAQELKNLWASRNGSKMTEARRLANIERNRVRWQKQGNIPKAVADHLRSVAARFVWWKPASESMEVPQQILASIMDAGTFADIQALRAVASDQLLKDVLIRAEIGQFKPGSWTYWHLILNGLGDGEVPPMPTRKFA